MLTRSLFRGSFSSLRLCRKKTQNDSVDVLTAARPGLDGVMRYGIHGRPVTAF